MPAPGSFVDSALFGFPTKNLLIPRRKFIVPSEKATPRVFENQELESSLAEITRLSHTMTICNKYCR